MAEQLVYARGAELLQHPAWLANNTGWGSYRASHPAVQGEEVRGVLFRLPPGQRSPWHGASGWPSLGQPFPGIGAGAIYLAVQGEIDFGAGGAVHRMQARDMVVVNAVVYQYANTASEDALFWTLRNNKVQGAGPGGQTPPSSRIWQGDDSAETLLGNDQPYYGQKEPEHFPEETERLVLIRWHDYRRQPIEWHGDWGHVWGSYPPVEVDVSARFLRVPSGQVTEPQTRPRETLLIGVDNIPVEVAVDTDVMTVGSHDAVLVPRDTAFRLINAESREAIVFEMQASNPSD